MKHLGSRRVSRTRSRSAGVRRRRRGRATGYTWATVSFVGVRVEEILRAVLAAELAAAHQVSVIVAVVPEADLALVQRHFGLALLAVNAFHREPALPARAVF